ncbi:hypothetical protein ACFQV2_10630 [Actinokineospora soli]|uniref:DUF1508 domain-containing protein n=1 Tax=Actinokineospora soli TaxID=1048753 RepID=A0ABW2TN16_9PSEU
MAHARFQIHRLGELGMTWRFLSANNRTIAQSPTPFPDADLCRDAVRDLRERLAEASVVVARGDSAQLWLWRVRIAGSDVAVSSRKYHRRVQAAYASRCFLELVGATGISDAPRLLHS